MSFSDNELAALLEQAKWGSVGAKAVNELAEALKAELLPPTQRYTALHIVSRAGGQQHEQLLSRFLDSESDPMLARLALQALCDWLELDERYRDKLVEFVRWVPWDHSDDVRQMAMALSGKRLAKVHDPELLGILVAIANDAAEMSISRDEAIRALATSLGDSRDSLPPATHIQDPESAWSRDILARAQRELEQQAAEAATED